MNKDSILFKIGNFFICVTALGAVVAIPDTEDNRNPDIGPLTRMGVVKFEEENAKKPVILTAESLTGVTQQIATTLGEVINPLMSKVTHLQSRLDDLENRFKMSFDQAESIKAEKMLSSEPRTLVSE